jgi:endoglycosylceramidase
MYGVVDGITVTAAGEQLVMRGINLAGTAKSTEDHLFDLSDEVIAGLIEDGIDSVRLLVFWDAVQPDGPDEFDEAYVAAVAQRVAALSDAGLHVVLDMHQDLWGIPFNGHGAPGWACDDEIKEGYEPLSNWWLNYGTPQVTGCFDAFWADSELQSSYADAWEALAAASCDSERLVGFDLMNEPYAGSGTTDRDFEWQVLGPFFMGLMDRVEEACPSRLYFLEHSSAYLIGIADPWELEESYRDRAVYGGHFYPLYIHEGTGSGYVGDIDDLEEDLLLTLAPYQEQGVPIWVGEYGGLTGHLGFSDYMEDLHSLFLQHGVSSALWDYYLSDGGMAFLDAEGERKEVFDSVFSTPAIVLSPSTTREHSADFKAGAIQASFECLPDRLLRVMLPDDSCACSASPAGLLEPVVGPGLVQTACMAGGEALLECACQR